jgi:hypothetical protein
MVTSSLSEVSDDSGIPACPSLSRYAHENIARIHADIERIQGHGAPLPFHLARVEALMEELEVWEEAAEVYDEALEGSGVFTATIIHQVKEVGQWWTIRSYERAAFGSLIVARRWARAQITALRHREFPPREHAGVMRIVCEVWDRSDDAGAVLVETVEVAK